MDTLKEERWTRDKQLVEQRAREVGAALDIQAAHSDDAVQTFVVDKSNVDATVIEDGYHRREDIYEGVTQ